MIIDWENDTPRYQKHFNSDIPSDLSGIVYHTHIRDFFLQYFPAEVYDEYIKLTCAAVQKSHDEISIQVSPTLSLQYLAEFKANKKDWLASNKCRELRYTSAELSNTCYDMNIDPFVLDYWQPGLDYIATPFEPEIPE